MRAADEGELHETAKKMFFKRNVARNPEAIEIRFWAPEKRKRKWIKKKEKWKKGIKKWKGEKRWKKRKEKRKRRKKEKQERNKRKESRKTKKGKKGEPKRRKWTTWECTLWPRECWRAALECVVFLGAKCLFWMWLFPWELWEPPCEPDWGASAVSSRALIWRFWYDGRTWPTRRPP